MLYFYFDKRPNWLRCLKGTCSSDAGTGGGGAEGPLAPPQYFIDHLTLLQPGEGRLSSTITTAPPQTFLPSGITV